MKRRRLWLWVLVPIVTVLSIMGGIVWDAHRRADAVLDRHRKETDLLLAEFGGRDARRPPFGGEGVDGNAWELYRQALPVLGRLSSEEAAEFPSLADEFDQEALPDDHRLGGIFAALEPQIDILRQALRRRSVDPGIVFEQGYDGKYELLQEQMSTSRLLMERVGHLDRIGRPAEALEEALFGLAFAQDVGRRSAIVGLLIRLVCEGIAAWAVKDLLESHAAGSGDWETFARGLDALDRARPSSQEEWDSEELELRYSLLKSWKERDVLGLSRAGWRQLWSEKIMRAQALNRLPDLVRDWKGTLALRPWERIQAVERLINVWQQDTSLVLANLAPSMLKALRRDVKGLLDRTLLRVAIAIAWYETEKGVWPATLQELVPRYLPAVPLCPFTGKPLVYKDGRVWSVGADGIDDGGTPDPYGGNDPDTQGTDVVWTVKRRK